MRAIIIAVAFTLALAAPAFAEPFRMLIHTGIIWAPYGDFATQQECESAARTYSVQKSMFTACSAVSAWERYEALKQAAANADRNRKQTLANDCLTAAKERAIEQWQLYGKRLDIQDQTRYCFVAGGGMK